MTARHPLRPASRTAFDTAFDTARSARRGFTLIEVLLAVGIFSMVVGVAYLVLRSGIDSYARGREFVILYQNARAGLRHLEIDLRRAVSPAQSGWNIMPEEPDPGEDLAYDEYYESEEYVSKEEKIVFKGSGAEARFVIMEDIPGREPPWDLSEVRYFVDKARNQLVRETTRSVVDWNFAEWRLRKMYSENETNFHFELGAIQGALTNPPGTRRLVVAERVESVAFRYHGGNDWAESWNSQEQINPPATEEEQLERTRIYKKGLPHLVEVSLKMKDGDVIQTATEIPAWGKNAWYWEDYDPHDRRNRRT